MPQYSTLEYLEQIATLPYDLLLHREETRDVIVPEQADQGFPEYVRVVLELPAGLNLDFQNSMSDGIICSHVGVGDTS